MTGYNRITGRSVERVAALSDGIFAVAMTLLVLDLKVPSSESVQSHADMWRMIRTFWPEILTYLLSFITLGIFWNGQQAQLNHFEQSDRNLTWIHIAFLFAVSLMPFSTKLLAEFIAYRLSLVFYWLNIVLLGALLYASWRYARRARLLREGVTEDLACAIERRILVAQAMYAVGATLCAVNNYASIAVIVLIQLNFALAPRIPWLRDV